MLKKKKQHQTNTPTQTWTEKDRRNIDYWDVQQVEKSQRKTKKKSKYKEKLYLKITTKKY